MKGLLLHPTSARQLQLLVRNPPQSILLSGQTGIGLGTIVTSFAKEISKKSSSTFTISPDEKGTIKIETIRDLYKQTRTKQKSPRVIIIDNAEAMQIPAQNAFLKLLEEPPKMTIFILTTHAPQLLLPTIRSRVQEQKILPITTEQTDALLGTLKVADATLKIQLRFIANGLPAELTRLVNDKGYFNTRSKEMGQARDFLSATIYQKLVTCYHLGSDRVAALQLVKNSSHIVEHSLLKAPSKNLSDLLTKLLHTEEKLENDGHVRTQLLRLIVG